MITVKNVSIDPVLKSINIQFPKSQITSILGPNGSGKTTLLRAMAGLHKPDSGQILIDFEDVYNSNPKFSIYPKITMVFQELYLFPQLSVFGNLTINKKLGFDKEYFDLIVDKLGITHLLCKSPTKLSGGQMQLIALARAILLRPEYLLLDEPTSSLDQTKTLLILDLLRTLADDGMTIVMVTHSESEARSVSDFVVGI